MWFKIFKPIIIFSLNHITFFLLLILFQKIIYSSSCNMNGTVSRIIKSIDLRSSKQEAENQEILQRFAVRLLNPLNAWNASIKEIICKVLREQRLPKTVLNLVTLTLLGSTKYLLSIKDNLNKYRIHYNSIYEEKTNSKPMLSSVKYEIIAIKHILWFS